eukprot:1243469-Alexandrium_andersonii.AAC.1
MEGPASPRRRRACADRPLARRRPAAVALTADARCTRAGIVGEVHGEAGHLKPHFAVPKSHNQPEATQAVESPE